MQLMCAYNFIANVYTCIHVKGKVACTHSKHCIPSWGVNTKLSTFCGQFPSQAMNNEFVGGS